MSRKNITGIALAMVVLVFTSGCRTLERLAEVNNGPSLSKITNPTTSKDYRPVSMPMPAPLTGERNPNSLWRAGARAFFKDHRAKEIGDILTVELSLSDSAELENTTSRKRKDNEDTALGSLLGIEGQLSKILPEDVQSPGKLAGWTQQHNTSGDGEIERSEDITLTFAAVVTQILPNGALAIMGRQEIKVNSEMRELMVTGVIRSEDIDSDNVISHTRIAEMRLAYGGKGTLSDLQRPRWGMQVWDILFPF